MANGHIVGGLLGGCAVCMLLCLGLSIKAIGGKTAAYTVKGTMDFVMLVLSGLLAFVAIFMLVGLKEGTKWVAVPLLIIAIICFIMSTAFGVFLWCCCKQHNACTTCIRSSGVWLYTALLLACVSTAIGCLAFESRVAAAVDANLDDYCDENCVRDLTMEWSAVTKTRGGDGLQDDLNAAEVKLEVTEIIKSNIDTAGWTMILLSMYVTIEVICLLIITKACGKHGMQIYKGGTDKCGQVRVEGAHALRI